MIFAFFKNEIAVASATLFHWTTSFQLKTFLRSEWIVNKIVWDEFETADENIMQFRRVKRSGRWDPAYKIVLWFERVLSNYFASVVQLLDSYLFPEDFMEMDQVASNGLNNCFLIPLRYCFKSQVESVSIFLVWSFKLKTINISSVPLHPSFIMLSFDDDGAWSHISLVLRHLLLVI